MSITGTRLVCSTMSCFLSDCFLRPAGGWTRRKALVGRDSCCPLHPWIARHVAGLPQGSSYTFVQHNKRAHEAFLPLLCSGLQGFRKTNKPLKILGSRDEGQGFSCAASRVRVAHWGKRKPAALLVWRLPVWCYKELLSCLAPHNAAWSHWRLSVKTSFTSPTEHQATGLWRRRGHQLSSLLVGVSFKTISMAKHPKKLFRFLLKL